MSSPKETKKYQEILILWQDFQTQTKNVQKILNSLINFKNNKENIKEIMNLKRNLYKFKQKPLNFKKNFVFKS